jgi:ABC-type phosphate transport system substrate-binding protein
MDDYANPLPPLIQTMTLVVGREKGKSLDPAVLEFLAFALSATGQAAVTRDNFRPLEIAEVHAGFDRVGFSSVK